MKGSVHLPDPSKCSLGRAIASKLGDLPAGDPDDLTERSRCDEEKAIMAGLLASIESSIRQDRALAAYRFDPKRPSTLKLPTLLLTGSETASPQLKRTITGLLDSLPNRSLFVFEGQQHNATGYCSATVRRDGWELLAEHDKQNTHKH